MKNFTVEDFESYHRGTLDATDRAAFESALHDSATLKDDYQAYLIALKQIEIIDTESTRSTIKNVEQALEGENFFKTDNIRSLNSSSSNEHTGTKKIRNWSWLAAAAVIIGAGIFLLPKMQSDPVRPTAKSLLAQTIGDVDKSLDRLEARGMGNPDEVPALDTLTAGLECYKTYDYDCAKDNLEYYNEKYPGNQQAEYYLGLVYMGDGEYAEAVEMLQPLMESADKGMRDNAKFYCAFSASEFENSNFACKVFDQIANDYSSEWQENAEAFLTHFMDCDL